jgi:DNA polymerase elongation subunit (family B)
MKQNYEKVLYPFVIVSKKRYVGNLYEEDPNKYKQKSMGIVLKRRDNAPIVKIICGSIIDKILNERSSKKAVQVTKEGLINMLSNKYPIDKFIISKTLKGSYKKRSQIAHAVLADRMALRDPGNKPESNDRIPYVHIITDKNVELQGDKIEHPDYVIKNKLEIDYLHYIENQIMKPSIQFLELIVNNPEEIFNHYKNSFEQKALERIGNDTEIKAKLDVIVKNHLKITKHCKTTESEKNDRTFNT